MISTAVVVLAISMIVLLPAAYLLGRHLHRRQYLQDELSPVTRQHIDLFQGGQLSEIALETAKDRLRGLLERGELEAVEAGVIGSDLGQGTDLHDVMSAVSPTIKSNNRGTGLTWRMVFAA